MTAKEKPTAREYPNDPLTVRVRQALKSGRKMTRDADGWFVDAETSELIGPDPAIERELTDEDFKRADLYRGDELIRAGKGGPNPRVAEAIRRTVGRPPLAAPKQAIKLRLDPDVLEYFRATGPGWQTRINNALRRAAKLKKTG